MKKSLQKVDPTLLVLFGSTGHLSANYLIPTLYDMDVRKLIPDDLRIVCVGRRNLDKRSFLEFVLKKSKAFKKSASKSGLKHFAKHIEYYQGDLENPKTFSGLQQVLADFDRPKHTCYNRLYYFATAPEFFLPISRILKDYGLLVACSKHERRVRVLIEKPFGGDLRSAHKLNQELLQHFQEEQIYRIDHYLGKETVQNLMVVRFANSLFEPLWNAKYIEHIEISMLEKGVVGGRGEFYDNTGALKDVVQNHLLQILALSVMDEPVELKTELIRDEKMKVLKALAPFTTADSKNIVTGQYEGYEQEAGRKSKTETFVAMKLYLNNPRWKGVPIYIRTGKALPRKVAEVSFHFKEPLKCLFRGCDSNILTLQIQPEESVHVQINSKVPGFGVELEQINLKFGKKLNSADQPASAYDRLLLDFIQGDQRMFIRSDEIEAAWTFIDSVSKALEKLTPAKYKQGSGGPAAADDFIKKDGRQWWTR